MVRSLGGSDREEAALRIDDLMEGSIPVDTEEAVGKVAADIGGSISLDDVQPMVCSGNIIAN